MKVKLYSLLLILVSVLTLCGCRSTHTDSPGDGDTTGPDELSSLKNYLIEDSEGLYDLTSIIDSDDCHKLCNYVMYDSHNILLIYVDFTDTTDPFYYFELLNIKTLEKETLDFKIAIAEEYSLYFSYYLDVLSVSPLVVYDYVTYTLYNCENNFSYQLPESLTGGFMYYYSDTYYYYLNDTLYTINGANEPEAVWTLPKCYSGSCHTLSPAENLFAIEAYTIAPDDPIVYITLNLDTYATDLYTVTGTTDDFYSNTVSDGRFCMLICDWEAEPSYYSVRVADVESNTATTVVLPDFINDKTIETEEHDYTEIKYVYLSEIPLYGNYCGFAMQDSDCYLSELYMYNLGSYAAENYDDFEVTSYEQPVITYEQLKKRASEIDEAYDITVIFGDDALTEYSNYTSTTETNEYRIDYSLDILEDTLALYPVGFFTEIQEEFCVDIVFYLAGPLYTSTPDTSIGEAGAITYEENGMQIVAFNTYQFSKGNVVHELTHILDNYLIYSDILWEYEWSQLNPDDFYYYYSYIDEYGNEYTYSDDYSYTYVSYDATDEDIYFFDTYAKTFPTEDRARLMEHLLDETYFYGDFYGCPNVIKKMNYYFSLIRQGFDSSDWDDETAWESCLAEAINN